MYNASVGFTRHLLVLIQKTDFHTHKLISESKTSFTHVSIAIEGPCGSGRENEIARVIIFTLRKIIPKYLFCVLHATT